MNRSLEEYREKLRPMLPELAEKYGVAELGFFGSRVRGDHRDDSDLDVLVSFRADARPTLITLVDVELAISDRLGLRIDLVMKKNLKPTLKSRILLEEVAV